MKNRKLSNIFRSVKNLPLHPTATSLPASSFSSSSPPSSTPTKKKRDSSWSVYLIISSRLPRTYVGITTDLSRRLRQHNGELKGGAKASRAGAPWAYACIIKGFNDQSEEAAASPATSVLSTIVGGAGGISTRGNASEFEAKWKGLCRRLPRKYKKEDSCTNSLIRHREEALGRVMCTFDDTRLQVDWSFNSPFG